MSPRFRVRLTWLIAAVVPVTSVPVLNAQTHTIAGRDTAPGRKPDLFAIPIGNALGDSATVARLDSATRVAIYAIVLNTAYRDRSHEEGERDGWLLPHLLKHDRRMMGDAEDSTTHPTLLKAVAARTELRGFCDREAPGWPVCPNARPGARMYALSRIYRINGNAVRVYVLTEDPPEGYDDPHRRVLIANMQEDVFRVERQAGGWVVTAQRLRTIT